MLVAVMLVMTCGMAWAQSPSIRACWRPDDLSAKTGEERISRGSAIALKSVPARNLAPFSPIPKNVRQVIRRVKLPDGLKLVALTFDLCEATHEITGYQGRIVDYLRRSNTPATFFAGGKWLISHAIRAQQLISDPLFEIGNHGWEHRNLRLLKGIELSNEVRYAQLAYEQTRDDLTAKQCLGREGTKLASEWAKPRLNLFRFPFGGCSNASLDTVGDLGLRAIQWDVSSGDPWFALSAESIVQGVLKGVRPGSIVLFHANGRGWRTGTAIPRIIEELKSRGYAFVTVSELLRRGEPEYSPTCYDHKPGDTDRYDSVARRIEAESRSVLERE